MKRNFTKCYTIKALILQLVLGAFFYSINAMAQERSPSKAIANLDPEAVPKSTLHAHSFGIGLGETFLAGHFSDHGDDRITIDALYTYSASYSFDLLVNAHYSEHTLKDQYIQLQGLTVGIKAKLYQFDSFSPFVLGGLGFYRPKALRYRSVFKEELVESQKKTAFGFHFGGGADLRLNNSFTVGLLGHYHNPFDVKQDTGPDVEGSYFKLLITLMYTI